MNYKKYTGLLANTIQRGFDLVLPPRCPQTGHIVEKSGDLSVAAWRDLTFISDPKCSCCGFPFEVVDVEDSSHDLSYLCGSCLESSKPYQRARAALIYNDASRNLVLAFKHGDQTHLIKALVPMLVKAGGEMLKDADLIVPVPLHWMRLVRRRYNQSALLAKSLSRLTGITYRGDVLGRIRSTPSQGHKSNKERHENVRNAFSVPDSKIGLVKGRKIVVVDDVHTTGATVEECARALLDAGAARVDILTVARVVKS